jgi:hypothetical protein
MVMILILVAVAAIAVLGAEEATVWDLNHRAHKLDSGEQCLPMDRHRTRKRYKGSPSRGT